MIAATSCVTRPSGKRSSAARGSSGGGSRTKRGVEVGDQHVVGLDRLKAPRLQAPLQIPSKKKKKNPPTVKTSEGAEKRTGPSV